MLDLQHAPIFGGVLGSTAVALLNATPASEFGYPAAFGVMAASYLAAAALLILIRER